MMKGDARQKLAYMVQLMKLEPDNVALRQLYDKELAQLDAAAPKT